MNEARLSPCRTCGKEISTNLAKRSSYMRDTESVGCPHCGEAEPHLTEEEKRRWEEKPTRPVGNSSFWFFVIGVGVFFLVWLILWLVNC